jgi:ferredoxin
MTAAGRIEIDRDVCSGHARCLQVAPDLFDLDDEGVAMSLRQPVTAAELDEARRAAMACPEAAIRIGEAG